MKKKKRRTSAKRSPSVTKPYEQTSSAHHVGLTSAEQVEMINGLHARIDALASIAGSENPVLFGILFFYYHAGRFLFDKESNDFEFILYTVGGLLAVLNAGSITKLITGRTLGRSFVLYQIKYQSAPERLAYQQAHSYMKELITRIDEIERAIYRPRLFFQTLVMLGLLYNLYGSKFETVPLSRVSFFLIACSNFFATCFKFLNLQYKNYLLKKELRSHDLVSIFQKAQADYQLQIRINPKLFLSASTISIFFSFNQERSLKDVRLFRHGVVKLLKDYHLLEKEGDDFVLIRSLKLTAQQREDFEKGITALVANINQIPQLIQQLKELAKTMDLEYGYGIDSKNTDKGIFVKWCSLLKDVDPVIMGSYKEKLNKIGKVEEKQVQGINKFFLKARKPLAEANFNKELEELRRLRLQQSLLPPPTNTLSTASSASTFTSAKYDEAKLVKQPALDNTPHASQTTPSPALGENGADKKIKVKTRSMQPNLFSSVDKDKETEELTIAFKLGEYRSNDPECKIKLMDNPYRKNKENKKNGFDFALFSPKDAFKSSEEEKEFRQMIEGSEQDGPDWRVEVKPQQATKGVVQATYHQIQHENEYHLTTFKAKSPKKGLKKRRFYSFCVETVKTEQGDARLHLFCKQERCHDKKVKL